MERIWTPSAGLPEQAGDLLGDASDQFRGEVLTAGRHGHLGPAHDLHDRSRRHAQHKQHGCGCVTCVVEPGVSNASFSEEGLPSVVVGAGSIGRPCGWEKTQSPSFHSRAALLRSSSCAALC